MLDTGYLYSRTSGKAGLAWAMLIVGATVQGNIPTAVNVSLI